MRYCLGILGMHLYFPPDPLIRVQRRNLGAHVLSEEKGLQRKW